MAFVTFLNTTERAVWSCLCIFKLTGIFKLTITFIHFFIFVSFILCSAALAVFNTNYIPSDQKENKSRVLPHPLLYRKVRLRLAHTLMYTCRVVLLVAYLSKKSSKN
jgi:hypothetical protein